MHALVSPHSTADLHLSILDGTDEMLTHADVLTASREQRAALTAGPAGETDLHAAMERQLGL